MTNVEAYFSRKQASTKESIPSFRFTFSLKNHLPSAGTTFCETLYVRKVPDRSIHCVFPISESHDIVDPQKNVRWNVRAQHVWTDTKNV